MVKSIRDNWVLVQNEKNEVQWKNKVKPIMWCGVFREPNMVVVTQRIANPEWQVLITSSEMLNGDDIYTVVGDESLLGDGAIDPCFRLFPNYKSKESAVRRARKLMQKYPKGLEGKKIVKVGK